ncbi:class I adenylate-forming enzyme family protein [Planomonospora parontospora]|uniref:class I adenylate-forming enzyme family protein n=1 Tax=Planomonospora parontospora TaxID=58119 RepID=UPI00166FF85B|nr:class I adenylate-forming enzyme family protein [Planomonospora parontospora]GGL22220.1 fatty-acid CoA ligase [Planomonospora parontospora subsp. antibiotica]GII15691.1 fatty-acid CoA ligase [Planomonospora parontospora subsp. antibiotica]
MVNLTVTQLLGDRALADPDGVALIVQGSAPLTYGQWHERSTAVANGLVERGVARGDRVGLVFGNADWADYAVAFFGVLKAGAAAVPLSDRSAAADLRFMLGHCGAAGVVHAEGAEVPGDGRWTVTLDGLRAQTSHESADSASGDPVPALPGPPGSAPGGPARVHAGPPGSAPGGPVPTRGRLPEPAPGDLAQILYTSGTTGRPKGVSATHANLAHGCGARRRPFAHSRHLVHAFPIGTNAGQTMLVNALDACPAVVTPPRFTPGRFAALIEEYRAGTVFLVPAMAIELLNAGVAERYDLSSVLLLGSAAAPLPAAVAEALTRAFPRAAIANYYTSTEAAPAQTIMMFDPERPGSVGRAVAGGRVRIATPHGEPLPQGETGEVWMRSAAAPRSYYGDPGSGTFRDGWIRMGDLGRLDPDGYLYLVDREGDVVKSGAYKVSTIHVEEAVFGHPAVVEAAAFGVPHPVLGTVVAVAVVVREPLTAAELRLFLADRLAPQELPAHVVEVAALPRNAGGKVDKRALRESPGSAERAPA